MSEKQIKKPNKEEAIFIELDRLMGERIEARNGEIVPMDYNLLAIAEYSPRLAMALFNVQSNEKFGVYMGKDPLDVNIINNETMEYLYDSPAKDIETQLYEFENNKVRHKSLFLFGIGNGVLVKSLLDNPSHTRIVVFEPEIEILYIALNLLNFYEDIKSERLIILHPDMMEFSQLYTIAKMPDCFVSSRLYELDFTSKYYESARYHHIAEAINKGMARAIKQNILELGNDARDSLIGLKHSTRNIPYIYNGYAIKDIFEARKKAVKTAVIVSTGPSLNKQLNTLKKIADKVAIIAVDASYPVLKKAGIRPDFVASIERVQPTSRFFDDPVSEFDDEIVFCVASLTHGETVRKMKGRNTAYFFRPIDFDMGFDDFRFGYIGGGPSAAHAAFNIATGLECENIVLIGQDLAFGEDGTSHSKGHIYGSKEIKTNEPTRDPGFYESAPAYGGDGVVKSTIIWNLFRTFFENTIAMLDRSSDTKIYNCTEGGARIAGTIEVPFKDIAKTLKNEPIKRFKLVKKISKKDQKIAIRKAQKRIKEVIKYGSRLQKRCEKLFLKVAKVVKSSKRLVEVGKSERVDYIQLQQLSFEIDVLKETMNEKMFLNNFYGCAGSMLMHQEMEIAVIAARKSDTEEEKDAKLLEWVGVQGYWLFSVAGSINTILSELKNASKKWLAPKDYASFSVDDFSEMEY